MVVVFVGSMLIGVVRQYPTYSNASSNLRAFAGGCGLADDVLVEPDANAGFLTPLPGRLRAAGTARRRRARRLHPQRRAGPHRRRVDSDAASDAGHRLRLGRPGQAERTRASTGRRVPLPYGLDPTRVPVAGTYVDGPHSSRAC